MVVEPCGVPDGGYLMAFCAGSGPTVPVVEGSSNGQKANHDEVQEVDSWRVGCQWMTIRSGPCLPLHVIPVFPFTGHNGRSVHDESPGPAPSPSSQAAADCLYEYRQSP